MKESLGLTEYENKANWFVYLSIQTCRDKIIKKLAVHFPEVREGDDVDDEVAGVHPPVPGVGQEEDPLPALPQLDVLHHEDGEGEGHVGPGEDQQAELDLAEGDLAQAGPLSLVEVRRDCDLIG